MEDFLKLGFSESIAQSDRNYIHGISGVLELFTTSWSTCHVSLGLEAEAMVDYFVQGRSREEGGKGVLFICP